VNAELLTLIAKFVRAVRNLDTTVRRVKAGMAGKTAGNISEQFSFFNQKAPTKEGAF
jgi:hypothetical protein